MIPMTNLDSKKEEIEKECKDIEKKLQRIINVASVKCIAVKRKDYMPHVKRLHELNKEWD